MIFCISGAAAWGGLGINSPPTEKKYIVIIYSKREEHEKERGFVVGIEGRPAHNETGEEQRKNEKSKTMKLRERERERKERTFGYFTLACFLVLAVGLRLHACMSLCVVVFASLFPLLPPFPLRFSMYIILLLYLLLLRARGAEEALVVLEGGVGLVGHLTVLEDVVPAHLALCFCV